MRNFVTPSPLVETSYTAYASWYDSLSIAEKLTVDLAAQEEHETISRQIGMEEIDNQDLWPENWPVQTLDDLSDEDCLDMTSDE